MAPGEAPGPGLGWTDQLFGRQPHRLAGQLSERLPGSLYRRQPRLWLFRPDHQLHHRYRLRDHHPLHWDLEAGHAAKGSQPADLREGLCQPAGSSAGGDRDSLHCLRGLAVDHVPGSDGQALAADSCPGKERIGPQAFRFVCWQKKC